MDSIRTRMATVSVHGSDKKFLDSICRRSAAVYALLLAILFVAGAAAAEIGRASCRERV